MAGKKIGQSSGGAGGDGGGWNINQSQLQNMISENDKTKQEKKKFIRI